MENKKQQQQQGDDIIEFKELISILPREKNWEGTHLHLYQDSWYPSIALKALVSFQKNFQAHNNDIILASTPKSGTTWLKAIIYLITNRSCCALNESPLLSSNPHDLVPFFEFDLFLKNQCPDLDKIADPRIFATHIPYPSLPTSITNASNWRIVYVCRNPLDQLISHWHFLLTLRREDSVTLSLEEAFELYCQGIHSFGPFWNHVLGYWKASQENPDKVLFLKYEDLKEDITVYTKRLAEFLGFPFSAKEEEEGVVEEICRICSFENLKSLEVNKNGRRPSGAPNNAYFRKGEVGDWSNHLSPSMAERMNNIVQEKLKGSGLVFDLVQNR